MEKPTRLVEYTKKFHGRALYLGSMRLTKFPSDVFDISTLTQLYLPDNFLPAIPPAIGRLVNLQQLYVDNNVIGPSIPQAIANLKQLRVLSLSQNRLVDIPAEVAKLRCLDRLVVDSNLLCSLPQEVEGAKVVVEGLDTNAFLKETPKRKRPTVCIPKLVDCCLRAVALSFANARPPPSAAEDSNEKANAERGKGGGVCVQWDAVAHLPIAEHLQHALVFVFLRELADDKGAVRCGACNDVCWSGVPCVQRLKWTTKTVTRQRRGSGSGGSGSSRSPADVSVCVALKYHYCSMQCAQDD